MGTTAAVHVIREAATTLPDYPSGRPGESLDQNETCDVEWVKSRLLAFLEDEESSMAASLAEAAYERRVIDEARAIVAGTVTVPTTVEHLRVLLNLLPFDRQEQEEVPF